MPARGWRLSQLPLGERGVHLGHPGQHQKTFTPKDELELAFHPSTQMLVFGLCIKQLFQLYMEIWLRNYLTQRCKTRCLDLRGGDVGGDYHPPWSCWDVSNTVSITKPPDWVSPPGWIGGTKITSGGGGQRILIQNFNQISALSGMCLYAVEFDPTLNICFMWSCRPGEQVQPNKWDKTKVLFVFRYLRRSPKVLHVSGTEFL